MIFKIKKANDQVICVSLGQPSCKKWHIVVDENGSFDAIRCFALRRQPKCKYCWLANTIGTPAKKKGRNLRKQQ